MRPFSYERAADLTQASRLGLETGQGQTDAPVQFLAGGTSLIDLMKLDVLTPERVVDITPLRANHATVQAGRCARRQTRTDDVAHGSFGSSWGVRWRKADVG